MRKNSTDFDNYPTRQSKESSPRRVRGWRYQNRSWFHSRKFPRIAHHSHFGLGETGTDRKTMQFGGIFDSRYRIPANE